ncbi:MBL fold metallo-hydrolase [Sphingomonas sp. HITSZ_GF]|uniref:MBL fold metallo-hydrolase n=1 Tax=Sphingomonas sp. HITSZ_GF TaxID=3037247 RepID=UPI00240DF8BA|nr:MBL fold metallo-hydrolase [Sphingomonas sp. HITSZ_GF]MDG2535173.1 MBL fold metallo-hydrolase [Sphingomonas sp. HITSZ_GF]
MRTSLAIALLVSVLGGVAPAAAQEASFVTLGTNSGPIPNPKRAEPANLLRFGDQDILIDAGDGAAWQLAKAGVPLKNLHAILISHLHFDHTGGLFALISQRYQMLEPSPFTVYGPPGTKALVDGIVATITASSKGGNNMRAFMPGAAGGNVTVVELADGASFDLGAVKVRAVRNTHFVATPGGDTPDALSFAYRFDMGGKAIVYTGDTGASDAVTALAKGADLLVSEIMDPDIALAKVFAGTPNAPQQIKDMIAEHFRREHVSPLEAGLMASRAGVKQLVLTHNALPDDAIEGARASIAKNYKGPVTFAQDLDKF